MRSSLIWAGQPRARSILPTQRTDGREKTGGGGGHTPTVSRRQRRQSGERRMERSGGERKEVSVKCIVGAIDGEHELPVVTQAHDAPVGDADVLPGDHEPERCLLVQPHRTGHGPKPRAVPPDVDQLHGDRGVPPGDMDVHRQRQSKPGSAAPLVFAGCLHSVHSWYVSRTRAGLAILEVGPPAFLTNGRGVVPGEKSRRYTEKCGASPSANA